MNKRGKVRALFDALVYVLDKRGIKPADKAAILNAMFCICKCGTPLFVWRVTEFPPGYTTVYCPDCLSETIIEAGPHNQ